MTTQTQQQSAKKYLMVFVWLCVLTAVEVGLVYIDMSKTLLGFLLVVSALAKAALVAMYFMHLKFEGRLIYFIVIAPIVIAIIFVLALFPDIVYG